MAFARAPGVELAAEFLGTDGGHVKAAAAALALRGDVEAEDPFKVLGGDTDPGVLCRNADRGLSGRADP